VHYLSSAEEAELTSAVAGHMGATLTSKDGLTAERAAGPGLGQVNVGLEKIVWETLGCIQ